MAIVNFPANPSIGDQYNENGITYTWNGAAWTANGAENTDARYVQVTGDTMTGNLNVPSINGGHAGPNNLVINGGMRIAQRGTSATSGGYATIDRMDVQFSQGAAQQSQQTLATTDLPFTEDAHSHFLRVTNTTGSTTAAAYRGPATILEAQDIATSGWNYKSESSFITLSFWVRASVSQEFYASLKTYDTTEQNYVFSFTPAANTWTKVTKSIPGNSNLQFDLDNGPGLKISISAFWGTNWTDPSVTTDSWQTFTSSTRFPDFATTWASTDGATFDVTGIQLTATDTPVAFQHEDYGTTLTKCQRYYLDFSTGWFAPYWHGYDLNCYRGGMQYLLPSEMRANPTVTTGGFSWVSDPGVNLIGSYGGTAVAGANTKRVTCYINTTSQPPAGINGQCNFHVYCNAEL